MTITVKTALRTATKHTKPHYPVRLDWSSFSVGIRLGSCIHSYRHTSNTSQPVAPPAADVINFAHPFVRAELQTVWESFAFSFPPCALLLFCVFISCFLIATRNTVSARWTGAGGAAKDGEYLRVQSKRQCLLPVQCPRSSGVDGTGACSSWYTVKQTDLRGSDEHKRDREKKIICKSEKYNSMFR